MLGNTVYFLDFKNNTVKEGVVYDEHITSSGYPAYQILTGDSFIQLEQSLCCITKEGAEQKLLELKPLADEITELAKSSQSKIDNMREQLLGVPTLSHLKGIK